VTVVVSLGTFGVDFDGGLYVTTGTAEHYLALRVRAGVGGALAAGGFTAGMPGRAGGRSGHAPERSAARRARAARRAHKLDHVVPRRSALRRRPARLVRARPRGGKGNGEA
jgi:hypothetical protein